MSLEERKQKFTELLQSLLKQHNGVKSKLAQELEISPSTLTHWIQGKIDPAGLDILTFRKLARVKSCSIQELAQLLGLIKIKDLSQVRFRNLLQELLLDKTQEELARRVGINRTTISKWLSSEQQIDWGKISAKTMLSLSQEKNWTLDKLYDYLKLETDNKLNGDRSFIQNGRRSSSFCVALDREDITLASYYTGNLTVHTHLKPENIKITTTATIPDRLGQFDTLVFDISDRSSPSLKLIEETEFKGDIIVFVPKDLPEDVRSQLQNKVTDVVSKPIDWNELKNKPYLN